ncbi:hypothetical protein [Streptococcus merionis]|uniref:hypothetical protein n=1 Tax=Streptococcus merionis TaxID=400065 RepID=UPI0026EED39F|nr:hypothetical protein [Streptococcus merionis]
MKVNKTRETFFSLAMAFAMSFCMEYYNLSLNHGGASYKLFSEVLGEVWWITIMVFFLQQYLAGPLASKLQARFGEDVPSVFRPTLRRICTVCVMCPVMAVVSSILFKHPWGNFIPTVLTTLTFNFPMAFSIQVFLLGPLLKELI